MENWTKNEQCLNCVLSLFTRCYFVPAEFFCFTRGVYCWELLFCHQAIKAVNPETLYTLCLKCLLFALDLKS